MCDTRAENSLSPIPATGLALDNYVRRRTNPQLSKMRTPALRTYGGSGTRCPRRGAFSLHEPRVLLSKASSPHMLLPVSGLDRNPLLPTGLFAGARPIDDGAQNSGGCTPEP
jgi:hypothetical protein